MIPDVTTTQEAWDSGSITGDEARERFFLVELVNRDVRRFIGNVAGRVTTPLLDSGFPSHPPTAALREDLQ